MSTEIIQDKKNKFAVYKIVRDKFSLTEKSLKLFKYRLFYERLVSKEYKAIIKDSPDLRIRKELPPEYYKNMDEGWKVFNDTFRNFVITTRISYKEFHNNKIKIENQEIKLKKAIEQFYLNEENHAYLIGDFNKPCGDNYDLTLFYFKNEKNEFVIDSCDLSYIPSSLIDISTGSSNNFKIKYANVNIFQTCNLKTVKMHENLKKTISDEILKRLEYIGKYKMPSKNKLELVFSLNFADWFLCSTGENWSSCLNLESDYEGTYWHGLPGLIGDKNRALVYITDGQKKEYNGIIVDRIISRTWGILCREKIEHEKYKNYINFPCEYPNRFEINKLAKQLFDIPEVSGNCVRSRYYIESIWQETTMSNGLEFLSMPYLDNSGVSIAKKNKAKYIFGGYLYYKNKTNNYRPYIRDTKNEKLIKIEDDFTGFNCQVGLSNMGKYEELLNYFRCNNDIIYEEYGEDDYEGNYA